MKPKILFVDDDPNVLAAFQRTLRNQYNFDTALGGTEALEKVRTGGPFALLVVDMSMPGMNGLEFLELAQKISPESVRIMLTGNADQRTAVDAVNRGQVFRFLNKPCPPEVLTPAIESGLSQFALLQMERELLEGTVTGSVRMLSEVLGMVAPDALGRGQRLRGSMKQFAEFIGAKPLWELEVAALLSSIGFASLPPQVLAKISAGDDRTLDEEKMIRRVPQIGHDLLMGIPRLAGVAGIVLFQSKCFDGSDSASVKDAGAAIPVGARMLKILVERLALENDGVVKAQALNAMKARKGHYDPDLLEKCFQCFPTFLSNNVSVEKAVHSLYVRELEPDLVVVSDIKTPQGMILVGAGNRLTKMVIQKLKNYEMMGQVREPVLVQDPKNAEGVGDASPKVPVTEPVAAS